ncbi:MAG: (4Fe-4S)-binding protein [Anaerolineae bacterium]
MATRARTYAGEHIDVNYEVRRCIHAEECVRHLREVFDNKKTPWVQPDNGTADAIADTIHHCPSGALHYVRKDGGATEPIPAHNTIQVDEDGPLYVRGNVTVINGKGDEILHDTRVALCRCGESNNKPFCDNSHIESHFEASAR